MVKQPKECIVIKTSSNEVQKSKKIPLDDTIPKNDSDARWRLDESSLDEIDSNANLPTSKFNVLSRMYAQDTSGMLYEAIVRKMMYGPVDKKFEAKDLNTKDVQNDTNNDNDNDNNNNNDDDDEEEEQEHAWHYFVHYFGWNVKWDMWVTEDTLFESCPETKELAKNVKAALKKKGKNVLFKIQELQREFRFEEKKRKFPELASADDQNESKGQIEDGKNVVDSAAAEKQSKKKTSRAKLRKLLKDDLELPRKQALADRIQLPFALKKVLVDEWEIISQTKKVPNLPTTVSIKTALDQYLEHKLQDLATSQDAICQKASYKDKKRQEFYDMVGGITKYFDEVVVNHLLYRQEIAQFDMMQKKIRFKHMKKCEIYGCEYLLRLLVRLPRLLEESGSTADEMELRKVYAMIGDLVRYLQKNQFLFFKQTYRKPKLGEAMEDESFGLPVLTNQKKTKSTSTDTNTTSDESKSSNPTNGKIKSMSVSKSKVATMNPSSKTTASKQKSKSAKASSTKKVKATPKQKAKNTKHKLKSRAKLKK